MCLCLITLVVHGHGRGKRLGTWLAVKPCVSCFVSLQHVSMFDCVGGAQAWTRQAPWYVPCGEAVCVMCHEFPACVHASLNVFRQKPLDIYIIYLCPKRVQKLCLYQKQRPHV